MIELGELGDFGIVGVERGQRCDEPRWIGVQRPVAGRCRVDMRDRGGEKAPSPNQAWTRSKPSSRQATSCER